MCNIKYNINKYNNQLMESVKSHFANSYISFHIGCQNYDEENKNEEFKPVKESYNDVDKLKKLFKEELKFNECYE